MALACREAASAYLPCSALAAARISRNRGSRPRSVDPELGDLLGLPAVSHLRIFVSGQDPGQQLRDLDLLRVRGQGPAQAFDRRRGHSRVQLGPSELHRRPGVVRTRPQGRPARLGRGCRVSEYGAREAEIELRFRVERIDRHRPRERLHRFAHLTGLGLGHPEVEPDVGVLRLEGGGPPVRCNRLIAIRGGGKDVAKIEPPAGQVGGGALRRRGQFEVVPVVGDRPLRLPGRHRHVCGEKICIR